MFIMNQLFFKYVLGLSFFLGNTFNVLLGQVKLLPEKSFSHPLKVRHIGVEQGLSQGSNYSILRDSRGYMWFTSYEGLNCYNGKTIKVFRQSSNECSIQGSSTVGLVEDKFGDIWFGTNKGLNVWRFQEDCIDFFSSL